MNSKRIPWLVLIALVLLAIAIAGLVGLPGVQQQALLQALVNRITEEAEDL